MTEKSDFWIIEYQATIRAKVVFEEPLDKAGAIEAFFDKSYADIINEDIVETHPITKMEPVHG